MNQVKELNRASTPGAPERTKLKGGELQIAVPVNGLAVMEIQR
jgi:hypothetical protein